MARPKKNQQPQPLSEVMQQLQSGILVPLPDIFTCTLDATPADVLSLELMLKQMRRRHLWDFVQFKKPKQREEAWKKAERCQAGLYMITSEEKYNTLEQYAEQV